MLVLLWVLSFFDFGWGYWSTTEPSSGPVLAPVLVQHWYITGPVLTPVLAQSCPSTGTLVAQYWPSTGPSTGQVLPQYWSSTVPVLAPLLKTALAYLPGN